MIIAPMSVPRKAITRCIWSDKPIWLFVSLILTLSGVGSGRAVAAAATTREQSVRLHHIRDRINQVRDSLHLDLGLEGRLQIRVQQSEQKLARGRQALQKINSRIKVIDQNLRQAENRRQEAQARLDKERALLASQLRAAYMEQDQDTLQLFLSSRDPGLVGRMLDYYGRVAQARAAQIKAVKEQLNRLEKLAQQVRNRRHRLIQLQRKRQAAVRALQKDRADRADAVASLKARIASHREALRHLEIARKQVEQLLNSLRPVLQSEPYTVGNHMPFARLRGRLPWPIRGPILARFHAPEDDGRLHWQGLWIGAPEGAPVHACARGRVVYVGWISSYGLVVLVQHSNSYFSLYGHDENVDVHVGDTVDAGQIIARAGKTGGHDRSGLYFELRHGNRVLNPARWLTE